MHDLDRGTGRRSLRSAPPTAARSSSGATSLPKLTSPGRSHEHERHLAPEALLVACRRLDDLLAPTPVELHGQAAREQQRAHLRAQLVLSGQAQRREQPQADRLAVAVPRCSRSPSRSRGRRCARGSAPAGGRRRARLRRRPRASCARRRGSWLVELPALRRPPPTAAPPAISAVFRTSTQPAASSAAGSVASVSGSTNTAAGWW